MAAQSASDFSRRSDSSSDLSQIEDGEVIQAEDKGDILFEEDKEAIGDGKLNDKEKKLFIEALESYPCLWNTSLAVYKDKLKKVEASRAMASRFKLSIDEMKKVMHSLRTSMSREVKRMQDNKDYVSKWKFFKSMEFLKEEIINSLQCKGDKEWNENEVETLVEFYKENEFLWNHHLNEYRDRDKKELALKKLQDQLTNRSPEEIKLQWHKLKTIFDREDKRVQGSKRTGTGTDSVYVSTWKYYKLFMFTKQCKDLDESRSSLSLSTDEESEPSIKKVKREKFGKKEEVESLKMELWKEALNALKLKESETKLVGSENELHSFGLMVENTLLRFNNRRRAIAKKRICDVLFEAEMEQEDCMAIGESRSMLPQHFMMASATPSQYEGPIIRSSTPYSTGSLSRYFQSGSPSPSISSNSSTGPEETGREYYSSFLQDLG